MGSRAIGMDARELFEHFHGAGVDLETTRRRTLWWIQGLVNLWGKGAAGRMVRHLLSQARSKRNPAAWCNWVTNQEGHFWVEDGVLSQLVAGSKPQKRDESEPLHISGLLASLNFA